MKLSLLASTLLSLLASTLSVVEASIGVDCDGGDCGLQVIDHEISELKCNWRAVDQMINVSEPLLLELPVEHSCPLQSKGILHMWQCEQCAKLHKPCEGEYAACQGCCGTPWHDSFRVPTKHQCADIKAYYNTENVKQVKCDNSGAPVGNVTINMPGGRKRYSGELIDRCVTPVRQVVCDKVPVKMEFECDQCNIGSPDLLTKCCNKGVEFATSSAIADLQVEGYHPFIWLSGCDVDQVRAPVGYQPFPWPHAHKYSSFTKKSIDDDFDRWIEENVCIHINQCKNPGKGPATTNTTTTTTTTTTIINEGEIRLKGGNGGILEARCCDSSSNWYPVCDDKFATVDADVACGQLGWGKSKNWQGGQDVSTDTFALDDVECTGSEHNLWLCPHVGRASENCGNTEGVRVVCTSPATTTSTTTTTTIPTTTTTTTWTCFNYCVRPFLDIEQDPRRLLFLDIEQDPRRLQEDHSACPWFVPPPTMPDSDAIIEEVVKNMSTLHGALDDGVADSAHSWVTVFSVVFSDMKVVTPQTFSKIREASAASLAMALNMPASLCQVSLKVVPETCNIRAAVAIPKEVAEFSHLHFKLENSIKMAMMEAELKVTVSVDEEVVMHVMHEDLEENCYPNGQFGAEPSSDLSAEIHAFAAILLPLLVHQ